MKSNKNLFSIGEIAKALGVTRRSVRSEAVADRTVLLRNTAL